MIAPVSYQRDLALINPKYFAVFYAKKRRWEIRCWHVEYPTLWDIRDFNLCEAKSHFVHRVCERDEDRRDIGYRPLDGRTLYTLSRAEKTGEDPNDVIKEVDRDNELRDEKADKESEDLFRTGAKRIRHYAKSKTVYYGYKGAR